MKTFKKLVEEVLVYLTDYYGSLFEQMYISLSTGPEAFELDLCRPSLEHLGHPRFIAEMLLQLQKIPNIPGSDMPQEDNIEQVSEEDSNNAPEDWDRYSMPSDDYSILFTMQEYSLFKEVFLVAPDQIADLINCNVYVDHLTRGVNLPASIVQAILIAKEKLSEELQTKQRLLEAKQQKTARLLKKSTSVEALSTINIRKQEVAVFGSDLGGYTELRHFYEAKPFNKITYHFDETNKILGMDRYDLRRIWAYQESDHIKEPRVNCTKKPSKGTIIDIMQENIRRYYNQQALIAIELISQRSHNDGSVFDQFSGPGRFPQHSGSLFATYSGRNTITGAEVRLIWRLYELDDAIINHILDNIVNFVHVTSMGEDAQKNFVITSVSATPPPWQGANRQLWENRKRSQGASGGKMKEQSTDWVARLLEFKNKISEDPKQYSQKGMGPQLEFM